MNNLQESIKQRAATQNKVEELKKHFTNLKMPQKAANILGNAAVLQTISINELINWLDQLVLAKEQCQVLDKKLTNLQIVENLMMYSKHGSLVQIFVIEAIRFYAEREASRPMPDNTTDPINPRHWWAIANEINDKLKEKLGS